MPSVSPVLENYYGISPPLGGQGFQTSPSFGVSPNLQATGLSPAMQQQPPAHTRLPQHPLIAPYAVQPAPPSAPITPSSSMDANLAALLNGLQGSAASTTGHETGPPALGRAVGSAGVRPMFNGFTPIEQQLMMQAQAQQRVLEAQSKALEMHRAVVFEAQARLAQQPQNLPLATVEIVPTPAERAHQQANHRSRTSTNNNNNAHGRLATMEYGQKAVSSAPHTRSTTLPSAPRVSIAPADSPLMASPALSFSARSSPSASSSVGLSPMTPAFVPSSLPVDNDSTTAPQNVKTVGSGENAVQIVGLGVDMGGRGQQ
jgi:hypothetical protein